MRNTEQAENSFRFMQNYVTQLQNDAELGLWTDMSHAGVYMSRAVRDLYDRLQAIEHKIDIIIADLARRPNRL